MSVLVVKRHGRKERFDERKAYASCFYAARSCHLSERESEKIAGACMKHVRTWCEKKKEVTSQQVFDFVDRILAKHNKEVAFMYRTHRDVS